MWIPGRRFARGGIIQYDNGGNKPKFFDYHVMVFAYTSYDTERLATLGHWNVGKVNTFIQQMYFTDQ
jgi:hypothetical protein